MRDFSPARDNERLKFPCERLSSIFSIVLIELIETARGWRERHQRVYFHVVCEAHPVCFVHLSKCMVHNAGDDDARPRPIGAVVVIEPDDGHVMSRVMQPTVRPALHDIHPLSKGSSTSPRREMFRRGTPRGSVIIRFRTRKHIYLKYRYLPASSCRSFRPAYDSSQIIRFSCSVIVRSVVTPWAYYITSQRRGILRTPRNVLSVQLLNNRTLSATAEIYGSFCISVENRVCGTWSLWQRHSSDICAKI